MERSYKVNDWNWDIEVVPWSHSIVGQVTLALGIEFTVWKSNIGTNGEPFRTEY